VLPLLQIWGGQRQQFLLYVQSLVLVHGQTYNQFSTFAFPESICSTQLLIALQCNCMILQLVLFLALLLAIFGTGRLALKHLFLAGGHVLGSPKLITWMVAVLLLPGTLIHELSHWLVAELLRVPTGKLSIIPSAEGEDEPVRLGSLQIAQVDPLRRTLVGLAPLVVGLSLLWFLASQFPTLAWPATTFFSIKTVALFYAIFVVANSMFSSKKDLEVAVLPVLLLILAGVLVWRLPISVSLPPAWSITIEGLLDRLDRALVLVLALNCVWLGASYLLHRLVHR
jgi:hypothetical protein